MTDPCFINQLPDDILRRIFSHFSIDHRINTLEFVCKKWRTSQRYSWHRFLDLDELHCKFCPKPIRFCRFDEWRHFPFIYKKRLNRITLRLIVMSSRFSRSVEILKMRRFFITTEIASLITAFYPKLCELDISSCYISPGAAALLTRHISALAMDGDEVNLGLLSPAFSHIEKLKLNKIIHLNCIADCLPFLTSLGLCTVDSSDDFRLLTEKCANLTSFSMRYAKCIQSSESLALFDSDFGYRLTSLCIALRPNYLNVVFAACCNLQRLLLKITDHSRSPVNLSFLRFLPHLREFGLTCRFLNDADLLRALVVDCFTLHTLRLDCKHVSAAAAPLQLGAYVADDDRPRFSCKSLDFLRISVRDASISTHLAARAVRLCEPGALRKCKVARQWFRAYDGRLAVKSDEFCNGFYASLLEEKCWRIETLCLPCLGRIYPHTHNGEEQPHQAVNLNAYFSSSIQLLMNLLPKLTLLRKLYIYGGFPDLCRLYWHTFPLSNLQSLVIGPYFHSLQGFELLVSNAHNLRKLSFHETSEHQNLLEACGAHSKMQILQFRGISRNFLLFLDEKFARFKVARRTMLEAQAQEMVRSSFLTIFCWVSGKDFRGLPEILEQHDHMFNDVMVKFRVGPMDE